MIGAPATLIRQTDGWASAATEILWSPETGWLGPVVHAPGMSALAGELAEVLGAMGGPVDVVVEAIGLEDDGIRVGLMADYGGVPETDHDYVIWSSGGSVLLLGRTLIDTERAVWRFAELLGYRDLAPTEGWQIAPPLERPLVVQIALAESRLCDSVYTIGSACGLMADGSLRWERWTRRNGLWGAEYRKGHVWPTIIATQDLEPPQHSGVGNGQKLCVLDPVVQAAAVAWAKAEILDSPDLLAISMGASDGTLGWDVPCLDTAAGMTPSDRQIYLGNHVQAALDLDPLYRGVRVCILAYGDTSRAPSPGVTIHPRLIVIVADLYIKDGREYEEVRQDYLAAGATDIGPYSYLSVWQWTHGEPRGLTISEHVLFQEVQRVHLNPGPLRLYATEAASTWGPDGIGYWTLGRLLRDPSLEVADLRAEYLAAAFPGLPMATFYDVLVRGLPLTTDLLHRLYSVLRTAMSTGPAGDVAVRLRHLAVYVRYLELLLDLTTTPSLAAYEAVMAWMYRARNLDLVAYRCSFFDAAWAKWRTQSNALHGFTVTPFVVPWPDVAFTPEELDVVVDDGVENNPVLPFDLVSYPHELELVPRPHDTRGRGTLPYSTADHSWLLWMRPDQSTLTLTARAGMQNSTSGPGTVRLVELETETVLHSATIPPDQVVVPLSWPVPGGAMYRLELLCAGGVDVDWPGYTATFVTSLEPWPFVGQIAGYYLVPAGTKVIGGYSEAAGARLIRPNNSVAFTTTSHQYFACQITPPVVDEIWRFDRAANAFCLLTIPPGIAMHPDELLTPVEPA